MRDSPDRPEKGLLLFGRVRITLRGAFGAVLWIALAIAVLSNWEEVQDGILRAGIWFPVAVVLIVVGHLGGAVAWSELQPSIIRKRSMVGYLASQPAKYLPIGAVAQAIGQVGLTALPGTSRKESTAAFFIHAWIQIGAMGVVALFLFVQAERPLWLWVIAILPLSVLLTIRQPVVAWLLRIAGRVMTRLSSHVNVPSSNAMRRSMAWTLVPAMTTGLAFAALLGSLTSPASALMVAGSFAAAWIVGFALFPLPSGLGAREFVLVALIPAVPIPELLGLSLIHRFATIAAEALLLLVVSRKVFTEAQ